jgi:phenylalanyl-tRNA synthetase beta chain
VHVGVPSCRPDIDAEIDLIEEVARVYGYDNIPATYPQDSTAIERGVQPRPPEDECRAVLKGCGFSEVITFSFGSPADMVDFFDGRTASHVEPIRMMKNPLTEDESVLRTSLIPGLLQSLRNNVNAGNKNLKLFEAGKVYRPAPKKPLPDERMFVCAAATGRSRPVSWRNQPTEVDFFDMKGVAETLLESLGCAAPETVKASHPGFHPGICADIVVGGKIIGRIGSIHPRLLQKYEIDQQVSLFEIDLSALKPQPAAARRYEKLSRFPYSDRDLAVVVDEAVEAAALSSAIAAAGGEILRRVLLFDVYRGKQVGEGRKSLAFGLRFQSDERTLTDEEITAAMERIVEELERQFDAKLRS